MKERLDILVVKKGLAESREKAKALIMSGDIFVNGERDSSPFDCSISWSIFFIVF